MNDTSKQVLGHMVSILAIMTTAVSVDMYAVQQNPTLLTTEMPYFMVIVVGEVVGMSWYATTFSVTPSGIQMESKKE